MRNPDQAVVMQLWRYPAKSMMGESLDQARIGENGLLGDRGWAVRDELRGGIRGAKKIAGLMRLAARYVTEPTGDLPPPHVEVTLDDGSTIRSDDAGVNRSLSAALDHPVTLSPLQPEADTEHYRRGPPDSTDLMAELRDMFGRTEDEPLPDFSGFPPELVEYESLPGTYFDAYPIHIVTTASLHSLERISAGSRADVRRFRPNVLVDLPDGGADFPEQAWIGRTVGLGEVTLEVVSSCPRCVMVTRSFADLPEDRALLRTVIRSAGQNLGVYAKVARPGLVHLGDELTVR